MINEDMAQELSAILDYMDFGMKNLGVIQSALAEKATDLKNCGDALYCVYVYLTDLHDQMTALVNRAIKSGQADGLGVAV